MSKIILPKVSIIFSNLNGGKEPLECLFSIGKLNYPKNKIETIVIDNGSVDGSPDKIAKKFPKVKLIRLKSAIGLPPSLNLGIKKSQGKYIFIGNDDIVLEKNSILGMVDYLEKNKEVGVVGGKVFYKDKPKKLTDSASGFNFYLGDIKKPKSQSEILWLQSCSIMIPKSVFDKIGLFDEGFYPLYFDDFDFCLRVKKANLKLAHLPDAIFWHGWGKTTEKSGRYNMYCWWYRNKIRFMLKNASPVQIISFLTFQIVATVVRSLTERQNILYPLFRAIVENILILPQTIKARTNSANYNGKKQN
ncbi:hypothetical protein A2697_03375 [Candidatus Curtissbacteria bacterium RIFCSPHIGHO2_01_FULL_41_44]|uniref:Glycosyltransferase 2-like domain-containing protein n=1 Tax=Candidatus Curtissbacteria bacterium RIFCSPLOWO2_01_FULL_42_50 TaxID=1797730 RepID=A0A1F5H593_9BACT|nr:MAG: hypothetical protein A3C33_00250 [Candidatus Curtissbacteria bacterium RIFCSPHIGHO2_02_FULL_42_58]OGD93598.1 MAG: hypothetical protein A2697_03375 [Candidatus Curtissbacteria bacterium RIFCSPHIGHO2_01_FULL_41_44]OGD97359.1 MAG: hypothetical protein A3E71_04130 [Candidatus Curtissbacteria bacterium RIFCSPHIGHO2_12_FULL_42_33]OGD99239.1 MAG: hypothetical protein A3B54_01570 [Candidatus Curtissbacteria bacterium RIFCSPLOWO2_01_FULL_42_50]OGE03565.1 MAG: hypothetical protein A3G16_00805 [Ca